LAISYFTETVTPTVFYLGDAASQGRRRERIDREREREREERACVCETVN